MEVYDVPHYNYNLNLLAILSKSHEQRLITKEHIARHTNLILLFKLQYFSDIAF